MSISSQIVYREIGLHSEALNCYTFYFLNDFVKPRSILIFWLADTWINVQQNIVSIFHLFRWMFLALSCETRNMSIGTYMRTKSDDKLTVTEQRAVANVRSVCFWLSLILGLSRRWWSWNPQRMRERCSSENIDERRGAVSSVPLKHGQ